MSSLLVNVKRTDDYDVYIGRVGAWSWSESMARPDRGSFDGRWGNTLRVDAFCLICGRRHGSVATLLPCYETWLRARLLRSDRRFHERFWDLEGKVLGCFCSGSAGLTSAKPWICHGQVMLALLEEGRPKTWKELHLGSL